MLRSVGGRNVAADLGHASRPGLLGGGRVAGDPEWIVLTGAVVLRRPARALEHGAARSATGSVVEAGGDEFVQAGPADRGGAAAARAHALADRRSAQVSRRRRSARRADRGVRRRCSRWRSRPSRPASRCCSGARRSRSATSSGALFGGDVCPDVASIVRTGSLSARAARASASARRSRPRACCSRRCCATRWRIRTSWASAPARCSAPRPRARSGSRRRRCSGCRGRAPARSAARRSRPSSSSGSRGAAARAAGASARLVLAGVAVGSFATAVATWTLYVEDPSWQNAIQWLLGTLAWADGARVRLAGFAAIALLALAWTRARDLDALALGEESARLVGVDTRRAIPLLDGGGLPPDGGDGRDGRARELRRTRRAASRAPARRDRVTACCCRRPRRSARACWCWPTASRAGSRPVEIPVGRRDGAARRARVRGAGRPRRAEIEASRVPSTVASPVAARTGVRRSRLPRDRREDRDRRHRLTRARPAANRAGDGSTPSSPGREPPAGSPGVPGGGAPLTGGTLTPRFIGSEAHAMAGSSSSKTGIVVGLLVVAALAVFLVDRALLRSEAGPEPRRRPGQGRAREPRRGRSRPDRRRGRRAMPGSPRAFDAAGVGDVTRAPADLQRSQAADAAQAVRLSNTRGDRLERLTGDNGRVLFSEVARRARLDDQRRGQGLRVRRDEGHRRQAARHDRPHGPAARRPGRAARARRRRARASDRRAPRSRPTSVARSTCLRASSWR